MTLPHAYIVEESNGTNGGGATWWTLCVGSIAKPGISISYRTKEAALADAPVWCALGIDPQLQIEVIPLVPADDASTGRPA